MSGRKTISSLSHTCFPLISIRPRSFQRCRPYLMKICAGGTQNETRLCAHISSDMPLKTPARTTNGAVGRRVRLGVLSVCERTSPFTRCQMGDGDVLPLLYNSLPPLSSITPPVHVSLFFFLLLLLPWLTCCHA